MKTSEFFTKKQDQFFFKSHEDNELSFDTNLVLAKFLGFKWDPINKYWWADEAKEYDVLDIIKTRGGESLLVILELEKNDIDQTQIAICAFDDKDHAKKAGFSWNAAKKSWLKIVPIILENKPVKEVCFSEIQEEPVSQEECEKAGIKTELYKFQRKSVAKMIAQKTCYNGSDMGNGKSLTALVATLLTNPYQILIVCPATLKFNWKNEILKHTNIPKEEIFILDTKNQEKYNNEKIIIVNYDILEKTKYFLSKFNFSHVIADEFHFCKNPEAKRTEAFEFITDKIEYKFFLSGTPITKNAADFFTASKFLGMPLLTDFNSFRQEYCYQKEVQYKNMIRPIVKFFGIREPKRFRSLIYSKYLRFEAKEVNLPEYMFQDFHFDATSKEEKELKKLLEDYLMEKGFNVLEAEQIIENQDVSIMAIKTRLALMKAKRTVGFALDLLEDEDQKIVVYSDHLDSSQEILELFKKAKIKAAKIDGGTSQKEREEAVKAFQEGDLRVLVGTSAIATGLTLTAANIMIVNDRSWNVATNEQLAKRIHRIGQDKRCIQYNMILNLETVFDIDSCVSKVLSEKIKTFKSFKE